MSSKVHDLKTWPEYFAAIWDGRKTFEVRRNDRNFRAGDVIALHEWEPKKGRFTGRQARGRITYVLAGGDFGVDAEHCVLAVSIHRREQREPAGGRW